jgi:ABC-type amino acid transport substrate-binding protein
MGRGRFAKVSLREETMAGKLRIIAFGLLAGVALAASSATAQDENKPKVTRASKSVPELIIGSPDNSYTANRKDFELVAGQGYRWKITRKGDLEYKFATDLFRNSWIDQIVINDLEVHMNGAPAWLEFDVNGTILVEFTTVKPGQYTWSDPDLADKGLKGTITVK